MARLFDQNGTSIYLVTSNSGPLKTLVKNKTTIKKVVPVPASIIRIVLDYKNGQTEQVECYHGSGYLSQSSRNLSLDDQVERITLIDSKGQKNAIDLRLKEDL